MEFIGFADAKRFVEISGISRDDLEMKVYPNQEFQEACMYRFGKGNKRYIKVKAAIDFIEQNIFIKETDL
ncbi:hypothetical protein K2V58_00190 [Staphylococcus arlettae]|uniref:hypothetical protein n=1 Tax=Staphylococcus arlettae TaxID=29378 RepID=UPI001E392FB9|nr:hypothetical protein [Staphylococcus arlettae]MCD8832725.1 hypothetical protein [Staphylococcus arlettae]